MDLVGNYDSEEEPIVVRDVEDDDMDVSDNESSSAEDNEEEDSDEAEEEEEEGVAIPFGSDLEYIANQVQSTFDAQTLPPHLQDTDDLQQDHNDEEGGMQIDATDASDDSDAGDMDNSLGDDEDDENSGIDLRRPDIADDEFGLTEEEAQLGAAAAPPKTQHELDDDAALIPLPAALEVLQVQFGAKKEQLRIAGEVIYRIDHEQTVVIQGRVSEKEMRDNSASELPDGFDAEAMLRGGHHAFPPVMSTTYSLNEGTVLCTENGVVVGVIHEVFGPVTAPFYIVRYRGFHRSVNTKSNNTNQKANKASTKRNNKKGKSSLPTVTEEEQQATATETEPIAQEDDPSLADAKDAVAPEETETGTTPSKTSASANAAPLTGSEAVSAHFASNTRTLCEIPSSIQPGVLVYTVPDHAVVLTAQTLHALKTIKGSDASNAYDEEVGEDEMEYSDDEEEMKAKKAIKGKKLLKADAFTNNNKTDTTTGGRKKVSLPAHLRNATSQPPTTITITPAAPIHVPIEQILAQQQLQQQQQHHHQHQHQQVSMQHPSPQPPVPSAAHYYPPANAHQQHHVQAAYPSAYAPYAYLQSPGIVYPPTYPVAGAGAAPAAAGNAGMYQYQPLTFLQPPYPPSQQYQQQQQQQQPPTYPPR